MAASRGARLNLGAEAALAFGAAVAFFLLTAVIPIRDHVVLILLLGGVYVYVVLVAARRLGPLYAVPLAIAGGLGFDSFYIPPTREFGASDWQNWLVVAIYLVMGVLIGMLAAHAGRRADVSEIARSKLADEQAALRRVATLVARGVDADQLLAAVAEEAGMLLDVDGAWIEFYAGEEVMKAAEWSRPGKDPPTFDRARLEDAPVAAAVRRSGDAQRVDDLERIQPSTRFAEGPRVMSLAGAPITVEGSQWGLLLAWSQDEPLPDDTEKHLTAFTELTATAIANSDARAEVRRLADQQAALRRVATLVARGVSSEELFITVCVELKRLLGIDEADMVRLEGDRTFTVLSFVGRDAGDFPVGTRLPVEGRNVVSIVAETERPARIDDYSTATGTPGELAKGSGVRSAVGCPIVVQGRLWGVVFTASRGEEALPADTESRIGEFTELVGTAIANAEARGEVATLADEQAALRRVATLVAEGAAPAEVFAAVAQELGQLLRVDSTYLSLYEPDDKATAVGSWSAHGADLPVGTHVALDSTSVAGLVRHSGQPARIDNYQQAAGEVAEIVQALGIRSSVGAPVIVEGQPLGVLIASSNHTEPLPADTESRIAAFSELVATAISNTQARAETRRLAEEQAALRRVATLVAEGVSPPEVFAAVAEEAGPLLGADSTYLVRYERDGTATGVGSWSSDGSHYPVGTRAPLDGTSVTGLVQSTGQSARLDDYDVASGEIAAMMREKGVRSSIGAPIVVDGQLWGVMAASSRHPEALPADAESRIARFTDLVATAISNTEARTETRRLAEEQAALRRVATLVAQDVPPPDVFAAVARELGQLLGVDSTHMARYEPDGTAVHVGSWSDRGTNAPVGTRLPLDNTTVTGLVHDTARPARIENYETPGETGELIEDRGIQSSAGAPIIVDGQLWGATIASSNRPGPLPEGTEARIAAFTDLVATAISNTEARTETRRLAEEQAALRRVATLVAREAPASEVFGQVAEEIGLLLGIENVWMHCYEPDDSIKVVASWGELASALPVGTQMYIDETTIADRVRRTGRPARSDHYETSVAEVADLKLTSAIGSPIIVDGHIWGVMSAATRKAEPLPASAEAHIEEFTQLVATAISNLQARSDLAASRARILAAEDDERRRVVRDLHDGAQQRLVHTVVTLQMANRALEREADEASPLVAEALQHAEQATEELRELAHGILPSVLTRGGLRAGVGALASRMPLPVENAVSVDRLPPDLEATAYFIVAEALTNVAKHSHANQAAVTARTENGTLHIQVSDDGVGGAQAEGPGLVGLADRVAALDGSLRLESPADGGTLIAADLPIP